MPERPERLRRCPNCEIGAPEALPATVGADGYCAGPPEGCGIKVAAALARPGVKPPRRSPKAGPAGIRSLLRLR